MESTKPARETERASAVRTSAGSLKILFPYVKRYRTRFAAALVAIVVSAMAILALPVMLRALVDRVYEDAGQGLSDAPFWGLLAVAGLLAVSNGFRFYLVTALGERIAADVRNAVFSHVMGLGAPYFDMTRSGEIMSRLTADTFEIRAAVGGTASVGIRNLILLVGATAMMAYTSPELTGLVAIVIPLLVGVTFWFGLRVRASARFAQETLAEASAFASEAIEAVRTVQAYTDEDRTAGRHASAVDRAYAAARAAMAARARLTSAMIFLVFASVAAILWVGTVSVFDGDMTHGTLSQFLLYAVVAAAALIELGQVGGELSQAAGAAERLAEVLETEPAIRNPSCAEALPGPGDAPRAACIAFQDVRFNYPARPDIPALRGVSFSVRSGETLAIVGPSGAGKSSIFQLLTRDYDATAGTVVLEGMPVRSLALQALRRRIAVVPQEPFIFSISIADNIRYGRPDADDAEVVTAAHMANVDEFVSAMPAGYETRLGERGVQLSGGQRQRIAIARAILKDAPILLLDEATASLDAESEALVHAALNSLMQTRTTLVIAHRLATVMAADRILVMDRGAIVDEGDHATLIRNPDSLYARLARLQFAQATADRAATDAA
ncbi:MAG: ABC transporter transmembrane domain-containing protein [Pseudomonadota bacterium]